MYVLKNEDNSNNSCHSLIRIPLKILITSTKKASLTLVITLLLYQLVVQYWQQQIHIRENFDMYHKNELFRVQKHNSNSNSSSNRHGHKGSGLATETVLGLALMIKRQKSLQFVATEWKSLSTFDELSMEIWQATKHSEAVITSNNKGSCYCVTLPNTTVFASMQNVY